MPLAVVQKPLARKVRLACSGNGSSNVFKLASFIAATVAILSGGSAVIKESIRIDTDDPSSCLYIPGGGHGGYFFKLGQLSTIPDRSVLSLDSDEQIYCSSSGCFAAVATLMGKGTKDKVSEMMLELVPKILTELSEEAANGISGVRYLGKRNRIQLKILVHWFAREFEKLGRKKQQKLLSKINIITTSVSGGVRTRRAANSTDLAHQLRATSWIPHLTADGWYLQDSNGNKLIDGDFLARMFPPRCDRVLWQPAFSWDLLRRMLQPINNLQVAHALWDYGYDVGVPWLQNY